MNARAHITSEQLRAIWTISKANGVEEDVLRQIVEDISSQDSTRALTKDQASAVLNRLNGERPRRRGKTRHREFDGRIGMATSKQLRKIEAMWAEIARAKDKDGSLRQFIQNRFGVSDLRFLDRKRASDVIVALEKMEVF
jgi:hypothetical protein